MSASPMRTYVISTEPLDDGAETVTQHNDAAWWRGFLVGIWTCVVLVGAVGTVAAYVR